MNYAALSRMFPLLYFTMKSWYSSFEAGVECLSLGRSHGYFSFISSWNMFSTTVCKVQIAVQCALQWRLLLIGPSFTGSEKQHWLIGNVGFLIELVSPIVCQQTSLNLNQGLPEHIPGFQSVFILFICLKKNKYKQQPTSGKTNLWLPCMIADSMTHLTNTEIYFCTLITRDQYAIPYVKEF